MLAGDGKDRVGPSGLRRGHERAGPGAGDPGTTGRRQRIRGAGLDQWRLADCYVEIGIVHARMTQVDESLAIHEKARAIQQGLIDRFPDEVRYRRALAENLNAIGYRIL